VAAAAVAAVVGALWARPLPLAVGLVALLGVLRRRPVLVVVGVLLMASALAARSWAATTPITSGIWSGRATLVTDPEPVRGSLRAVVSVDGRRVEAWSRGAAARALRPRLAGERVELTGELGPPPASLARGLAARHIVGRLTVHGTGAWQPGAWPWRAANRLRRLLVEGARSLPAERRALLSGLVLGDDRDQPPELDEAFERAGLTHLLAVSGQNVAFVLTVAAPLLSRLRLRPRLLASLAVLAFFALVTRFEPSVLRAVAMASAAALAATAGRPATSLRLLALAVMGLVAIDPLLVYQAGFQLSVLATAGIVVLAGPLARRLPGPAWLTLPLSVTLGAQVATAPLLARYFGGVPLAAVPANLLAGPVAGAAMIYGMAGGVVAGVLGELIGPAPAALVHVPTGLLLWWLAGVARWAADLPLGQVGFPAAVLLAALAVIGAAVSARAARRRGTTVDAVAPGSQLPP